MEVTNLLPSRVVRFLVPAVTNKPAFLPDIAADIRREFRFVGGPSTAEDYDLGAGVSFIYGTFKNSIVQKLQVYRDGVIAEAVARTEYLDEVIESIQTLLMSRYDLNFTESQPVSRLYNSRIEVKMKTNLNRLFPNNVSINARFSSLLDKWGFYAQDVETSGFMMLADAVNSETSMKPDRFIIERRLGHAFEECLFFSEAPLPTQEHIEFLQDLESLL